MSVYEKEKTMFRKFILLGTLLPFLLVLVVLWVGADNLHRATVRAEQGNPSAQYKLANRYIRLADFGVFREKYRRRAISWYRQSANQNYPYAAIALAEFYHKGRYVRQSTHEAVKWYQLAATHNLREPIIRLGDIYSEDDTGSITKNYVTALTWYELATENTIAPRLEKKIGDIYKQGGHGLIASPERAAKWYWQSAKNGNADAQIALAVLYETGVGVPQSNQEKLHWYKKAAKQGHSKAQTALANFYMEGKIIPQNFPKAFRLYKKAAKKKNAESQYRLGEIYERGVNISQDYKTAIKWYLKAARQNHRDAFYRLGEIFEKGFSVDRDIAQAYGWYKLASEAGNKQADDRLYAIRNNISDEEIKRGTLFIAKWQAKWQAKK